MNWSPATGAEVPPGVVTVTSTVPATPTGEVAVQVVVLEHDTEVPALAPNLAVVVLVPVTNPVPVTVTTVDPPSGPAGGLMEVTVGIGS